MAVVFVRTNRGLFCLAFSNSSMGIGIMSIMQPASVPE
jgi:hypothetical protein